MLFRFGLYLTGQAELARELAQETIRVALSRDWPELPPPRNQTSAQPASQGDDSGKWLRGILHNLLRNQQRKERRSRLLFDSQMVETAEQRFTETGADRQDVWQQRKTALKRCLEKLAAPDRDLLRQR